MSNGSHHDMLSWQKDSYLGGSNAAYLDELYEQYLSDPQSLSPELQKYFANLKDSAAQQDISHRQVQTQFRQAALSGSSIAAPSANVSGSSKQAQVDALIQAYRQFGNRAAKLNPLSDETIGHPSLDLSFHNLQQADLDDEFATAGILNKVTATLKEIIQAAKNAYASFASAEFSHISDVKEKKWLQDNFEVMMQNPELSACEKKWLLKQLTAAEGLESYLDIKYVGQKRFSVEGLGSLIPQLNKMLATASSMGTETVMLGMAHRGRLNVMLNVAGMTAKELFSEFEGKEDYGETSGDVRYHLGYSADVQTEKGPVHVALSFNPSHLEFINPVLAGGMRARQQVYADGDYNHTTGILLHGDAAFAGEGVVYESLSMAKLRAYNVGGIVHVITNNQIGFTTSDVRDIRSCFHCSDVAKLIEAPIFHVNADHAELAVLIGDLAMKYRMTFHKDVVINLVGYRRHGHQEVDEPTSSAPLLYQAIKKHPTVRSQYKDLLLQQNVCDASYIEKLEADYNSLLDAGSATINLAEQKTDSYRQLYKAYIAATWDMPADTRAAKDDVLRLAKAIVTLPEDFSVVRSVAQLIKSRQQMAAAEKEMDWGFAENMAYATLLDAGIPVRMSGEDVRRGTFFHRHAFWFDQKTGKAYSPLLNLSSGQAKLQMYDSHLSEMAAMGFEYGYSATDPQSLVLWEAQFGDFANCAQVIVDQFISSAWQKWQRLSGLTLLLPHGYDGSGPEHSSARLERYLQLAAQKNMQIVVPTTPEQIFHLLRRQVIRPFRHPLIVITPKNLLRHKLATSPLSSLWEGEFVDLIPEVDPLVDAEVDKVILCSGKLYYELLQARRENKKDNIALIRIEQLYPFPYQLLTAQLARYPAVKDVVWCQEEPKNQGAWYVSRDRIQSCLQDDQALSLVSRVASAAPAAGYHALHVRQQQRLIADALDIVDATS